MTIQCATHGESAETFVCEHLTGETVGLGFNGYDPTADDPYPKAWCDNCEIIRVASDGWNAESVKFANIVMICSHCYMRARIRNTKPTVTFDDLANLKWKCTSCEEWHHGPCLDFLHRAPVFWGAEEDAASKRWALIPKFLRKAPTTYLTEDLCVTNDEHFYVRGLIHLPIIGAAETFRWGVWGSLSRDNFKELQEKWDDPSRAQLPSLFSWLSSQIPEYPDTVNLKMHARIHEPGRCPDFYLEPTEHPLAQEFHYGISPERVREIMLRRLRS